MNTCRVLEVTPCANSLDELTSLDIYNAVWPRDAVTIGAVHAFRDSARYYVDYLVRDNGVILVRRSPLTEPRLTRVPMLPRGARGCHREEKAPHT